MEYTKEVLDHFYNPRNVGAIEDADGVGRLGDASCGDVFLMFIKVRGRRITDIRYLVQGCGAAIATCSALSELAKGKTLSEASALPATDIAEALGGLAPAKLHCSNLAATVLHRAINDYMQRSRGGREEWRLPYLRQRRTRE